MGRRSVAARQRAKIDRLQHENELLGMLNDIFKDEILGRHPAVASESASARAESSAAAGKSRGQETVACGDPDQDRRKAR